MSALVEKFFGNGHLPEEVQGELRTILLQMRNERNAFERLATEAQSSIEKVSEPVDTAAQRIASLEERLRAVEQLAEKAGDLDGRQRQMAQRIDMTAQTATEIDEAVGPIRRDLEQTKALLENATTLRAELEPLLDLGGQLQALRSDVSALRDELSEAQQTMGSVRQQHDAVEQGGTAAVERLAALEDRYSEMAIGLQAAEQRVVQLQGSMDSVSTLAAQVPDVRHELNTLRALREYVAQKVAELEQQRETVDYATSQGTRLAELVGRIDRELEAQQEKARTLVKLEEDVTRLRAVHDEMSRELDRLAERQREDARADDARRQEFQALQELMDGRIRDTIGRFEFEQERLEAASTQIADLREAMADAERRFGSLQETQDDVVRLRHDLAKLSDRVASIAMDLAPLDSYAERMVTVKSDVAGAEQSMKEVARQATELREAIAGADGRLADVRELSEQTERQTRSLTELRDYVARLEQRVSAFERAEAAVSQAIEDAARRQATVDALRADFQRMLEVAKETADQVRIIMDSHDEITDGRRLVDDVLTEIRTVQREAERLEARRREASGIDEQIARAEALLIDIRTTLETLHEQKAFLEEVMETAGSLRFQSKQAEALIDTLRGARGRVQAATG